jgi:hypothetical protein
MSGINKLLMLLISGFLILITTDSMAQSSKPTDDKSEASPNLNSNHELDRVPASVQEEKPHVIGENGEKIYFLTDPNKKQITNPSSEQSNSVPVNTEKSNNGQILKPE